MRGLGKYTIPIIGILSSGKSTFINGLFLNNTILEVGMAHTTKFICIIRHQPELQDGKFRFTKVKIESNSLIKDGETFEEETEIKKKITEINTKEIVSEDILNDFYLLELNIHLIDDKKANDELLKDVDFMDIPGLDFFEAQKENKNEIEKKKISNLFKHFKDKLKYFIIVFDYLRLQLDSGFTILERIKNEFNIKMENNLIVINKINLKPEKTIEQIKEDFLKESLKKPDIINYDKNIVLPINAQKILLQQQYRVNFELFIKYLYYLFCEKTLKIGKEDENNTFEYYIIDFVDKKKEELKLDKIDIKDMSISEEEIKKSFEQIFVDNFDTEQIKYIIKDKKEEFFNEDSMEVIKELYYLYLNNLIEFDLTEYKESKKDIINYLQNIEMDKEDKVKEDKVKEDKVKEEKVEEKNEEDKIYKKYVDKLDNIMKNNMIELENNNKINEECKKILEKINKKKNLVVNSYRNTKFRISVVGLSSAGKSYFINCLIGKKILETNIGETTKVGLIVENHDSDEISLYHSQYTYDKDENGKEYITFEENNDVYASGFDNVKEKLSKLNDINIHQEKEIKEGKIIFKFWILKIRIANCSFVDIPIQIIDFPGLNTSLEYSETEVFKNLVSTSNIIFHVLDVNHIKGEEDRKIRDLINQFISDYRLEPNFSDENTLYILNKLEEPQKEKVDDLKYQEDISITMGCKKDLVSFIKIKNQFYEEMDNAKNTTFRNFLKNYYTQSKHYRKKYPTFIDFLNSKIKNNKSCDIKTTIELLIKGEAITEFEDFLLNKDKNEYEKIVSDYAKKDKDFQDNLAMSYINKKISLNENGIFEQTEKLNNFIIEKFGNYKDYYKNLIKDFILDINVLLQNILNSRSIPKEELEEIKKKFTEEIENYYNELIKYYYNNFDNLMEKEKKQLEKLKKETYRRFFIILDKSKIREEIKKNSEEIVKGYNELNKGKFNEIIQTKLNDKLKEIIIEYEKKKNNNQTGKIEFKDFIENNIKIIENESKGLGNVDSKEDEWSFYSVEKKNIYFDKKYSLVKIKLQKYFDIFLKSTNKQKEDLIKNYLDKLSTSFGNYNQEEKKKIETIKTELINILNSMHQGINNYHSYVEESFKESENIFKNELQKQKVASNEGFGFKKMDICIYPGKNINLRGISIKIVKEFKDELSEPLISISFPPKNINLLERITSYLIDFEKSRNQKIFIIRNEKNVERISLKIKFIKNFKYIYWIEKFSYFFDKLSLFKFEFLTPIMFNQTLDIKAAYDILKSFLLVQIQGDIPIITIFEFLRVEKIVTKILSQLLPFHMRVLLHVLTSITFQLNTSVEEIPFETFVKNEFMQYGFLNQSLKELIKAFFGIPSAFIDSEDVEINFRLFKNNLKILLNLPVQRSNILENN